MDTIVLLSPKYENNVAMVVRLAAAYKIGRVLVVQPRYVEAERVPREIRMFKQVHLMTASSIGGAFDFLTNVEDRVPLFVAVERREKAQSLVDYMHVTQQPSTAYVFGPEDGDIEPGTLRRCHRFVQIPVECSLNLATAVATVLWDRKVKGALF